MLRKKLNTTLKQNMVRRNDLTPPIYLSLVSAFISTVDRIRLHEFYADM